ncbi:YchJ family protein [Criblamydia sequanensis]|uniref:YchJ-like middle NTF2-like domain-containing protein n=1 Tax=Candidatus Criblamydia sequanensis CRIB-18 TaxID=1437425 RepID=A0A090CZ28_9BACT|nr:YchJ family metal-binding protein [Criblamydia sequanensis]CDR33951.1 Conserved hypothetical protein [Criblamydia sequanensis CRIB-18]
MDCFCHSGKKYSECCEPHHSGLILPDSLSLMRSRYAAYAKGLSNYIIATTHPKNPSYKSNKEKWKSEIDGFCRKTRFNDLKIIDNQEEGLNGIVTFKAYLEQEGEKYCLFEKSTFEKVNGKWLYRKGELLTE